MGKVQGAVQSTGDPAQSWSSQQELEQNKVVNGPKDRQSQEDLKRERYLLQEGCEAVRPH